MRVGILGQGRIGRCLLRQLVAAGHHVVAVSDPRMQPEQHAHLVRNDSVHGRFQVPVSYDASTQELVIGSLRTRCLRSSQEEQWQEEPWVECRPEVLVDCSGNDQAERAARARGLPPGVDYLVLTRHSVGASPPVVLGANDQQGLPGPGSVVAAGSCTAHALLPVLRVLIDRDFPVRGGAVTVLHPYLASQSLLDNPNGSSDVSLMRAAPLSVMPAPSGLSRSIEAVFPQLPRFAVQCFRVPVPAVLTLGVTLDFSRRIRGSDIRDALLKASAGSHRGLLTVLDEPLVSSDLVGSTWSAAISGVHLDEEPSTRHSLVLFQDNEWAYCRRLVELVDGLARERRRAAS